MSRYTRDGAWRSAREELTNFFRWRFTEVEMSASEKALAHALEDIASALVAIMDRMDDGADR